MEFTFSADYEAYVLEYLTSIKNTNGNKYNKLTNKNQKFLFYNFNDYLNWKNLPVQKGKHNTVSSKDIYGLLELQRKNWPYFIKKTPRNI